MGLIDDIKNDVKKSGSNKGKIAYFREGEKKRIRFLTDMDNGIKVKFHDSFAKSINVPCQEEFGRDCPYCEDEELRTRDQYCWSIYDYDAKEVKLLLAPVNNCSPIPAFMAMYETYGTLTDRDYVVTVTGKQQNKTFTVVPMDKNKFRNEKAKALSNSKMLAIIDKAFPPDDVVEEDEDDEPKKKKRPAKEDAKKKKSKYEEEDEDIEDEDVEDEEEEDEDDDKVDYSELSAKELYKLCVERDIECEKKKPVKYYVRLLEDDDEVHDDWDDEDDE